MANSNTARQMRGRYRTIYMRMWGDEKFRHLSPLLPSGQAAWVYMLTGPHTGPIPGLFQSGRAGMAEALGWTLDDFEKAFAEVLREGLCEVDWEAGVVWISKAVEYNKPQSPNVVVSWQSAWDLIPECDLKWEARESLRAFIYGLGKGYEKAFDEAFGKASVETTRKSRARAEQEQEQEQEYINQKHSGGSSSSHAHSHTREDAPLAAAEIATMLRAWERERGKMARGVMASHPHVIELADQHVSADELRRAYDAAVADREATADLTPINAGFVRIFVDKHRNPPKKREDNGWRRSPSGIEHKASELGIYPRPGESHDSLRERCESVMRQRANGAAS